MAINKTINKSTKTHGAMRNCIEYVLKEAKTKDGYIYMTGPAPEELNWDNVYRSFIDEKKLWGKDNGRMYNHNIISFAPDEKITPEQAFEFGKEFAEKWFPNHQTLISVHQDREHVHIHLVSNTVSYIDGMKLHNSRADLQRMKDFTNEMCRERGLSIAEKGKHFDGTEIEEGNVTAWSKDKYNLINNDNKKSYVADCAIAVMRSKKNSCNKDEFIEAMERQGWHTIWTDNKKHITFKNDKGDKVRDSNISKTFEMDISKEALLHEFERQNAKSRADRERKEAAELERYYAEVESAIQGNATSATVGSTKASDRAEGQSSEKWQTRGPREDTTSFIRELRSKERASDEKREDSISKRLDREDERERLDREAERAAEEEYQASRSQGFSR